MIDRFSSAQTQNGMGQGSAGQGPCLADRLHQLAAYGALALIAGIVFGTGALPPL